jgi:protein O-GlcNAc transferase
VRHRIASRLESLGVDPARLEFQGASPLYEFLQVCNAVDLALDSYPFHGGLTTFDTLWMGVPVVSCVGETFAGRHSLTYLTALGHAELAVSSLDDYVGRVVDLANDLPRLAELRRSLRCQLAASPLCDGDQLAERLMDGLRGAWRKWTSQ